MELVCVEYDNANVHDNRALSILAIFMLVHVHYSSSSACAHLLHSQIILSHNPLCTLTYALYMAFWDEAFSGTLH